MNPVGPKKYYGCRNIIGWSHLQQMKLCHVYHDVISMSWWKMGPIYPKILPIPPHVFNILWGQRVPLCTSWDPCIVQGLVPCMILQVYGLVLDQTYFQSNGQGYCHGYFEEFQNIVLIIKNWLGLIIFGWNRLIELNILKYVYSSSLLL